MRQALLAFLVLALLFALGGCSIVYRLPTRQGNVIEQKQLDQLQVGQTRDQVQFLLGTPIASSPFRVGRWDYLGYYKDPRGKVSSRTVTLFFEGDKLARMDGINIAGAEKPLDTPDIDRIVKEQKKDEAEKERAESDKAHESGVTIHEPPIKN